MVTTIRNIKNSNKTTTLGVSRSTAMSLRCQPIDNPQIPRVVHIEYFVLNEVGGGILEQPYLPDVVRVLPLQMLEHSALFGFVVVGAAILGHAPAAIADVPHAFLAIAHDGVISDFLGDFFVMGVMLEGSHKLALLKEVRPSEPELLCNF
jgi:hypothetical protein